MAAREMCHPQRGSSLPIPFPAALRKMRKAQWAFSRVMEPVMLNYKYLIIGGGMTADAAVHGIREADPNGSIGLIGSEVHPPYNRPPLSKGLWKDKRLESIWRRHANDEAIEHLGRTALAVDPQTRTVTDDRGAEYHYQKLLLATGGTPRRLPIGGEGVLYFRTLDDYYHLRTLTEQGSRFAVIGAGFIGSEIAAALATNQKKVVMIFPEEGIGARCFPTIFPNT